MAVLCNVLLMQILKWGLWGGWARVVGAGCDFHRMSMGESLVPGLISGLGLDGGQRDCWCRGWPSDEGDE